MASHAGTAYYLTTGQATANTTIDADHEMTWINPGTTGISQPCLVSTCTSWATSFFSPDFDWDLAGGIFQIKTNGANDDIYLNIWDVTNQAIGGSPDTLTGTLVATADVAASAVTNSYSPVDFFFNSPVTLNAGDDYIATLTSDTGTNGSQQYDIKGINSLTIQDSTGGNGNPLQDPNTATPEPDTVVMMAAGGLLIALGRKRTTGAR